jgi:leucyl aminopeptidase
MSIKISYQKKSTNNITANLVLFTNDKFNTNNLEKYIPKTEYLYVNDLLKTSDLKKKVLVFKVNSKKKIILISIKENLKTSDIVNLGAEFYGHINHEEKSEYFLNSDSLVGKFGNFLGYFLHGLKLKSY